MFVEYRLYDYLRARHGGLRRQVSTLNCEGSFSTLLRMSFTIAYPNKILFKVVLQPLLLLQELLRARPLLTDQPVRFSERIPKTASLHHIQVFNPLLQAHDSLQSYPSAFNFSQNILHRT
jgi:hypothetical protein